MLIAYRGFGDTEIETPYLSSVGTGVGTATIYSPADVVQPLPSQPSTEYVYKEQAANVVIPVEQRASTTEPTADPPTVNAVTKITQEVTGQPLYSPDPTIAKVINDAADKLAAQQAAEAANVDVPGVWTGSTQKPTVPKPSGGGLTPTPLPVPPAPEKKPGFTWDFNTIMSIASVGIGILYLLKPTQKIVASPKAATGGYHAEN